MEIMKKLQLLLVSVAMLSIFSCSDDDDDTLGVWYRRSDFDGRAREDAAGFVIGNQLRRLPGSSPRVQVQQVYMLLKFCLIGIIPACAGTT